MSKNAPQTTFPFGANHW